MRNSSAHVPVLTALARRRQRALWARRAVVLVSCVLLLDAIIGDRGLAATIRARESYRRLSHSLIELETENAGLREQARRLSDDPAAIERAAREDLGLVKRGEILVVIKDADEGVRPPRPRRP